MQNENENEKCMKTKINTRFSNYYNTRVHIWLGITSEHDNDLVVPSSSVQNNVYDVKF